MKKSTFVTLCVVCSAFVLTVVSCKNSPKSKDGKIKIGFGVTLTTNSIKYNVKEKTDTCDFVVDYPTKGNPVLLQNLQEWISEQFGGTYRGSYDQGDSLLAYYGRIALDTMYHYSKDVDKGMALINTMDIRKIYETDKFVTYEASSYSFLGGAHGGATLEGATFRKTDGRKFGYDMFLSEYRYTKVQELIKAGLKQYFKVKTDNNLKDHFLDERDFYMIPLPQAIPYFTKDGIKFIYAQYEISCYADGMPTITVPYDKIKDCLTVPAFELF